MACGALEAPHAARGRRAQQGTSVHATRNRRTESVGRVAAGSGDLWPVWRGHALGTRARPSPDGWGSAARMTRTVDARAAVQIRSGASRPPRTTRARVDGSAGLLDARLAAKLDIRPGPQNTGPWPRPATRRPRRSCRLRARVQIAAILAGCHVLPAHRRPQDVQGNAQPVTKKAWTMWSTARKSQKLISNFDFILKFG